MRESAVEVHRSGSEEDPAPALPRGGLAVRRELALPCWPDGDALRQALAATDSGHSDHVRRLMAHVALA
jgi:hypothetical protein